MNDRINDELEFEANLGVALPLAAEGQRFAQGIFAASLTGKVTESLSLYGEVYGVGPERPAGSTGLNVDTGLLMITGPDTQVDLSYFRGLSGLGLREGLSVGITRRW